MGCVDFFSRLGNSGGKEMTRWEAWEPDKCDLESLSWEFERNLYFLLSPLASITLPKFNIAPEKWWLEDYFPFGMGWYIFRGKPLNFQEVFGQTWNLFFGGNFCLGENLSKSPTSSDNQSTPPGPLMAATSLAEAELLPWLSRSNLLRICPTKSREKGDDTWGCRPPS